MIDIKSVQVRLAEKGIDSEILENPNGDFLAVGDDATGPWADVFSDGTVDYGGRGPGGTIIDATEDQAVENILALLAK